VVYGCNSYTIVHCSLDIIEWFKYNLKKVFKLYLILIHPPLSINNWYQLEGRSYAKMEDNIPNGIPPFDGSNFEYWKNRMETYLKDLGADVWFSFASGYNSLKKPKTAA
jgi:hypothetical protein